MIRPLITALVEYILAFVVYKKGKYHPKTFAAVLFFLASYQLGEVIIFLTDGDRIGFQVAYFSTTLLPPLGLLLVQQITKRNWGYLIVQIIGLFFALAFVVNTWGMIDTFEIAQFCIKVTSYGSNLSTAWAVYYLVSVSYTMLIMLTYVFRSKDIVIKNVFTQMLIAYTSFFVVTMVVIVLFPQFRVKTASMMCALAAIGALIFTRISLKTKV